FIAGEHAGLDWLTARDVLLPRCRHCPKLSSFCSIPSVLPERRRSVHNGGLGISCSGALWRESNALTATLTGGKRVARGPRTQSPRCLGIGWRGTLSRPRNSRPAERIPPAAPSLACDRNARSRQSASAGWPGDRFRRTRVA